MLQARRPRQLAGLAWLLVVLPVLAACGETDPSVEEYVEKAEKRLSDDRSQAAVIALKNALQETPDHARANYLLGKAYLQTGRGDAALPYLSDARELGAGASDLPALLAQAHLAAGQPDEALSIVAAQEPTPALRLTAANAHARARRTGEARERYTALIREGVRVVDARLALARLMLDARRPNEALAHIDQALAQEEDHAGALYLKARANVMARRPEAALAIIDKLKPEAEGQNGEGPERRLSAQVRRVQIAALLATDRTQEAADALSALRKVGEPSSPRFKTLEARVKLAQGDYKSARQAGLAVLSEAPDATRAHLTVGLASARLDLQETARNHLRQVLSDHPDRARARLALANLLVETGRGAEAADLLRHDSLDYVDAPVRRALETRAALAAGRSNEAVDGFQAYLASLRQERTGSRAQIEAIRKAAASRAKSANPAEAADGYRLIAGIAAYYTGDYARARQVLQAVETPARLRGPALAYRIAARLAAGQPEAASTLAREQAKLLTRRPEVLLTAARVAAEAGVKDAASALHTRLQGDQPQLTTLLKAGLGENAGSSGSASDGPNKESVSQVDAATPRTWGIGFARAIRQGNFATAYKLADRVSQAKPKAADGPTMAAVAALTEGRPDPARKALDEALQREPVDPTAASIRASLAIRADQPDRAAELYQRVLESHPDHTATRLRLARLRLSQGEHTRARKLAERAAKDGAGTAAGLLQARIDLAAGDAQAALARLGELQAADADTRRTRLKLMARANLAAGQPDRAASIYRRLAGLMPDSAGARYRLARAEHRAGDTDAALEVLTALVADMPEAGQARLLRARLLAERGDLPRARKDVRKLLDANPDSARVHRLAAAVARAQDRPKAELQHLKTAQDLAPTRAGAIDRATALIRQGRTDEGLTALKAWIETNPDDSKARAALAEQLLAAGRMDPAIRSFEALPEDLRETASVQNNLAWAELKAGRPKDALPHAERATDRAGSDPRILDTKGMVLLALDRPEEARKVLAKANASSERPDIALHYAKALARSGATDKARDLLGPVVSAGKLASRPHKEARKLYESLE